MSGLRFNEGKSCDAVIRVLEARAGLTRCDLISPEREGHRAPVEFSLKLGEQLFALEHTGVEPFAGHMRLDAEAPADFDPIKAGAPQVDCPPATSSSFMSLPAPCRPWRAAGEGRCRQRLPLGAAARIRAACAKKFPKLAWWKLNAGARTVLVLEDNDIQLSNPQVIYEALAAVEIEFADRPDEVHVVSTFIDAT